MKRVVITKKEKELAQKFVDSLDLMAEIVKDYSKAEIKEGLHQYSIFLKERYKIPNKPSPDVTE